MKKIFIFLITLIFTLTACASQSANGNPPTPSDEIDATPQPIETGNQKDNEQDTKVLVVYFSATGNTKAVAEFIAEQTSADLFELEAKEPYSSEDLDWTNENSRVVYEHDNPEAREVELMQTEVDHWENYTTVYLGYPTWWQIAAWPINDFVESNDFEGKTIIPFTTSSSSGLGNSAELLSELANGGTWNEGHRFSSQVNEEEIQAWIDSLN